MMLEDIIRHDLIEQPRPRSRFKIDAFSLPLTLTIATNWLTSMSRLTPALSRVSNVPLSMLLSSRALIKEIFATSLLRPVLFSDIFDFDQYLSAANRRSNWTVPLSASTVSPIIDWSP